MIDCFKDNFKKIAKMVRMTHSDASIEFEKLQILEDRMESLGYTQQAMNSSPILSAKDLEKNQKAATLPIKTVLEVLDKVDQFDLENSGRERLLYKNQFKRETHVTLQS